MKYVNYKAEGVTDSEVPVCQERGEWFIADACYDIAAKYGDDGHNEFVNLMMDAINSGQTAFKFNGVAFTAALIDSY